tara:strand:+ start:3837 stop:4277 length:441 start_codon:yes stop_codon:yes gene_type:complete
LIDIIQTDNHEELYSFLVGRDFPNLKDHTEIVCYARIFKFMHNQSTAGFVWMYELLEEDGRFHCHLCIANQYKGKILNRKTVNKFYKMAFENGANILECDPVKENIIKLNKRIGWQQNTDHSVELKLPYIWRNNYGSSKKNSKKNN